jgi:hypothetical protein
MPQARASTQKESGKPEISILVWFNPTEMPSTNAGDMGGGFKFHDQHQTSVNFNIRRPSVRGGSREQKIMRSADFPEKQACADLTTSQLVAVTAE